MPTSLTKDSIRQQILAILLTKFENLAESASAFISLADTPWAEIYSTPKEHAARERIHAATRELESKNLVNVLWAWTGEGLLITKIYLNPKNVDSAYNLSGVVPRSREMGVIQEILQPLSDHPWSWVRDWWQKTSTALGVGKEPNLNQDSPLPYQDLVSTLTAVASLDIPITISEFSETVFEYKTYFDQNVRRHFTELLRQAFPVPLNSDEDLLDACNLICQPRLALFAGHLHFTISDVAYNLCLFPQGIGLPPAGVSSLQITHVGARRIILVEHLSDYYQLSSTCNAQRDLLILTSGYPNSSVRLLLRTLADYVASETRYEFYYYGSLDYRGITTLELMRQAYFPTINPFATYTSAQTLSDGDVSRLDQLMQDYTFKHWHNLIAQILTKQSSLRL